MGWGGMGCAGVWDGVSSGGVGVGGGAVRVCRGAIGRQYRRPPDKNAVGPPAERSTERAAVRRQGRLNLKIGPRTSHMITPTSQASHLLLIAASQLLLTAASPLLLTAASRLWCVDFIAPTRRAIRCSSLFFTKSVHTLSGSLLSGFTCFTTSGVSPPTPLPTASLTPRGSTPLACGWW